MKRRQRLKSTAAAKEFCGAYESYQVVCEAITQRSKDRETTPHEEQLVTAARSQVMRCYALMRQTLGMKKPGNNVQLVAELLEKFEHEEIKREAEMQAEGDNGGTKAASICAGSRNTIADGVRAAITRGS